MPSLLIDIAANVARMQNDMTAASTSVRGFADNASKSLNQVKTAFAALGVGIGLHEIIGQMKLMVAAASDLEEQTSKFNVVFTGQQKLAESWAQTLVNSYAMSTREAKQYLAAMQDLLVPMGMNAAAAAKMSFEVVKLAADLGSFNNVQTAAVMLDIQSALVGNYETMKKYGVVLKETLVQEKALAMGLAETKDELTANHKAQAAYQLILEGSINAIGDMARTSESYANTLKALTAATEDLRAELGAIILPPLAKLMKEEVDGLRGIMHLFSQDVLDVLMKQQADVIALIEATEAAQREAVNREQNAVFKFIDAIFGGRPEDHEARKQELLAQLEVIRAKIREVTQEGEGAAQKVTVSIQTALAIQTREHDAYLTKRQAQITKEVEAELKEIEKREKAQEKAWEERLKGYEKLAQDEYAAYYAPAWQAELALNEYRRKTAEEALQYRIEIYSREGELEEQAYNAKVQSLDKYLADYAEHVRRHGTLSEQMAIGVKVAFDHMAINAKTAYDHMYQITLDFAQNSRWTLEEVFFDGMSGDLQSFGDYWEDFWTRMKHSFSRSLADMAMSWAESQIKNVLTGTGSGSMSSILGAIGGAWNYLGSAASKAVSSVVSWVGGLFHEGGVVGEGNQQRVIGSLRSDEVLAILQRGEMVLTQDQTRALLAVLSAGADNGAPVVGGKGGYMSLDMMSDTLGDMVKGVITMNPLTFARGVANIIAYDQLGMNLGSAIMSPMTFAELAAINELGGFAQAWGDDLGTPDAEGIGLLGAMAALEGMGAAPSASGGGTPDMSVSEAMGILGAMGATPDYGGGYAGGGFGPGGGMSFGEAMGILGAMGAGGADGGGFGGAGFGGGTGPGEGVGGFGIGGYARGGIVPRDQIARVHQGEGVFTPEQLEHLTIAGEQPITVVVPVYIDGKRVSETVYEGMYDASRRKQVILHQRAVEGYTGTAGLDLPTQ